MYRDTDCSQVNWIYKFPISNEEKYSEDGVAKKSNTFGVISQHYPHQCDDRFGFFN